MIKKLTLFAALFLGCLAMNAQNVAFSEDFTGTTNQQDVGDLTDLGWSLYDEDGNVVNSQIGFIDQAWKIVNFSDVGEVMVTSSWFANSTDQADKWAVTPQITVPSDNPTLLYTVLSGDPDSPEAYEILVSTTGNTPADFTDAAIESEDPAPSGGMNQRVVSLEDYAGEDVYIAFRSIGSDGYLLAVDNITVKTLKTIDAELTSIDMEKYVTSGDVDIVGTITNNGADAITSFDVTWSVDGGTEHTETVSDVNITTLDSDQFTLDDSWDAQDSGEHAIDVSIGNINANGDDDDTDNDALATNVYVVSQQVDRSVVIEEGTGTWCGWCPRGIIAMEYMYDNTDLFPNFIGIAVHNNDPMTVNEYDAGAAFTGFPGSNVNRTLLGAEVAKDSWVSYYNENIDVVTPADIEAEGEYDFASRELTVNVTSHFYTNMSDSDIRLAVVLVEDGVSGTGNGWGQSNYYAGGASGPMGGFESKPQTVTDISYDRVGRALLGGYNGVEESVPSSINDGDSSSYEFTYTVPSSIKQNNMSMVAMVLDNETGAILNATEIKYDDLTLDVEKHEVSNSFKLYPNPASNYVNVSLNDNLSGNATLNIYNLNGKMVMSKDYKNLQAHKDLRIDVSGLSTGEYLLSFSNHERTVVKKLIVK